MSVLHCRRDRCTAWLVDCEERPAAEKKGEYTDGHDSWPCTRRQVSQHPGIPPLDDARFAGHGRVTSPVGAAQGSYRTSTLAWGLIWWRSATQISEPLDPNTLLHFGNFVDEGRPGGQVS